MALPDVTVGGKLLADPVLTFTEDGEPVTHFPVVSANFTRDATGKWVEEAECRLNVTARGRYAENAAESLRKGDLALIRGQLGGGRSPIPCHTAQQRRG